MTEAKFELFRSVLFEKKDYLLVSIKSNKGLQRFTCSGCDRLLCVTRRYNLELNNDDSVIRVDIACPILYSILCEELSF